MAVDQSGNVWIANNGADPITGKLSVTMLPQGDSANAMNFADAAFNAPFGLAVDATGNVWVANFGNDTVVELGPDGSVIGGPFGLRGTPSARAFSRPLGVAVDSAGSVWVANSTGPSITQINPFGRTREFTAPGMNHPWGVSIDGDDNVFITDFGSEAVSRCRRTPAVTRWSNSSAWPVR